MCITVNMGTADIRIRNDDEELRRRLNALAARYGDTSSEMLDRLVEFQESNPTQFEREVVRTGRQR